MVPSPYFVEVMCGWHEAILDLFARFGDACFDCIDQCIYIMRDGKWQHISRMPYWTDFEETVVEAQFQMECVLVVIPVSWYNTKLKFENIYLPYRLARWSSGIEDWCLILWMQDWK